MRFKRSDGTKKRLSRASFRATPNPIINRLLKKASIPPAQPRHAKTCPFPIFILGSKESSTGTQPPHHSAARTDVVLLIRRTVRPRGYASGASIGCGLADGLFEHPAGVLISYPRHADYRCSVMPELFFRGLLGTIAERRSCWSRLPAAARRTATSESCRLFFSNGVIGAPLMPRA